MQADPLPDMQSPLDLTQSLLRDAHVKYIVGLDKKRDSLEYWLTSHLRLNGIYWGTTALALLGHIDALDRDQVIASVLACRHGNGGYGGHPGHDPHLLFTLSAIQILATFDALDQVDTLETAKYVQSLQLPDGSFSGDSWGEVDTRFVYCAVSCLSILHSLDMIDTKKTILYLNACQNFDGGFGSVPGAESHAGQTLAILESLHLVDKDKLGWWLAERQLKGGGLNGRPEKLEDVCYSWWVLSSLAILDRLHWINAEKLVKFILSAQDEEGGIADRPGDTPDVFHTLFGLCGLSMLGHGDLNKVDPKYCMLTSTIEKVFMPAQ